MRLKRYEGRNLQHVLTQVHAELGTDAMLLEARPLKSTLVHRLLRRPQVEAWAASEADSLQRPDSSPALESSAAAEGGEDRAPASSLRLAPSLSALFPEAQPEDRPGSLGREHGVDALMRWRLGAEVHPSQDCAEQLMRCGLDPVAAWELAWTSSRAPLLDQLQPTTVLPSCLRTIASGEAGETFGGTLTGPVVALVGPTGAGKTTTIAKLAARLLLEGTERVALMSLDTYRIGAVEQLQTYARIMGIPLLVPSSDREARRMMREARKQYDRILIDTVGRSWRHLEQLLQLKRAVEACEPDEVHLTLPLTLNLPDAIEVVEQFRGLQVNRLLFTKLDETTQPGLIASVCWRCRIPASCLCNGQSVPEDIELATPSRLTAHILAALPRERTAPPVKTPATPRRPRRAATPRLAEGALA